MNLSTSSDQNIIERDIYCPYCHYENALLISGVAEKKSTLQLPAYGLKYMLSFIFTFGIYALINGMPWIEIKRTTEHNTYGFCSKCGKTYNAGVPMQIRAMKREPKLYRSEKNKIIFGLCAGISEYTGIPVKIVRTLMVIYSLSILPGILYTVIGAFDIVPFKPENPNQKN